MTDTRTGKVKDAEYRIKPTGLLNSPAMEKISKLCLLGAKRVAAKPFRVLLPEGCELPKEDKDLFEKV